MEGGQWVSCSAQLWTDLIHSWQQEVVTIIHQPGASSSPQPTAIMATETLKPVSFNLSADDESLLIAYFGVKVKDQILELHEKILANPTTKPDTFWPIYTSKIKDRALRGAIDYAVRRIFNSKLYTIVLDGELVAIRAALGGRDSLGSNATYPDFS